jgi:lysozyme family protein
MTIDLFEQALSRAMLYEVGGFWNLETPGVREGLIKTQAQRKAVGYTNDPDDHGGETKFGVAKAANPDLNIAALDWEGAKRVYMKRYWLPGDCQDMPKLVALMHFDGCVNHGVGRAATMLQKAVGATPDGDIGPATLNKVKALDQLVVCNKIAEARTAFYRSIVEHNPVQAKYLNGWLRRINETLQYVKIQASKG